MVNLGDIESAFLFVSSDMDNEAILDKRDGKIYYRSDILGIDEFPKDIDDKDFINIPDKHMLGLDSRLAFEFIQTFLPKEYDKVREIFRKSGAYSKFKQFLASYDLLKKWYQFEGNRTKEALIKWCKKNGIKIAK